MPWRRWDRGIERCLPETLPAVDQDFPRFCPYCPRQPWEVSLEIPGQRRVWVTWPLEPAGSKTLNFPWKSLFPGSCPAPFRREDRRQKLSGEIALVLIYSGWIPRRLRRIQSPMSEYIHKSHNVTVLLYHLVFPAKYRQAVFDPGVDEAVHQVCLDIEKRYQVKSLETGVDQDPVHFLVQSVPTYRVTKAVTLLKSLTAWGIFRRCRQVKKQLWGGEFWTDGYFASTVGKYANEAMISQ